MSTCEGGSVQRLLFYGILLLSSGEIQLLQYFSIDFFTFIHIRHNNNPGPARGIANIGKCMSKSPELPGAHGREKTEKKRRENETKTEVTWQ